MMCGWARRWLWVVVCVCSGGVAHAEPPDWSLEGALGFGRFEQQVKAEVGGVAGERLVSQTELNVGLWGMYRVWSFVHLGALLRWDIGEREAGQFAGFDPSTGKTVVDPSVGGGYQELWLGPVVRVVWRMLWAEVGYGALGVRWDEARADLPDEGGDSEGALRTHPGIAWVFGLGGSVSLAEGFDLTLRLEYRIRYYNRRSTPLAQELVHGTQNYSPLIGVRWLF